MLDLFPVMRYFGDSYGHPDLDDPASIECLFCGSGGMIKDLEYWGSLVFRCPTCHAEHEVTLRIVS
jgi:hypothetical protein